MLVSIRDAHRDDLDVIMQFIKELAEYEKLEGDAVGSRELFDESLFGSTTPAAKVVIASMDSKDVGFALYYDNFSTCTGRRGMHLEDLFVRETHRKCGIGRKLLAHLAKVAVQRGYLRFEWSALKW